MTQSTATRRLVKSPPELWAEVSSEGSLGRHLAEFGEIRITRVSPETTVAWEGDRASGTVELTPTGWGTKVLLTATPRTAAAAADPPAPAEANGPPADPPAPAEANVPPADPPAPAEANGPPADPPAPAEANVPPADPPAPAEANGPPPSPAPRKGFFARLFRKRGAHGSSGIAPASSIPAPPAPSPDPVPPAPTPDPSPIPPPAPDPVPPAPAPQPPAPPQIEVLDADRTVAILTEVLDDLGAAHHRPFSRE